ncbi:MAG: hypothetical protein J6I53_00855 [Treponema sp.]|nr:hypothetical protein [Treponema sp.]
MILTGLRGTGKSTFLLHHAIQSGKKVLYFSADNPRLTALNLYDVIATVFLQGYEQITNDNIRLMSAVVGTLSMSSIPRLQVRSLCADWNVSADKLYQLLDVMEAVGLVRIIRYPNDTKAKSAGAKLFFADPCLYSVLHGNPGNMREAFVTVLLQEVGYTVNACKIETEGDFVITKNVGSLKLGNTPAIKIEVGGKDKVLKQSDWVIRDNTDYPTDKAIPLWLLAMAW